MLPKILSAIPPIFKFVELAGVYCGYFVGTGLSRGRVDVLEGCLDHFGSRLDHVVRQSLDLLGHRSLVDGHQGASCGGGGCSCRGYRGWTGGRGDDGVLFWWGTLGLI